MIKLTAILLEETERFSNRALVKDMFVSGTQSRVAGVRLQPVLLS